MKELWNCSRNTESPGRYIRTVLLISICWFSIYMAFLYRPVPGLNTAGSLCLFCFLSIAVPFLGLSLSIEKHRNWTVMMAFEIAPLFLYTLISRLSVFGYELAGLILLALVLAVSAAAGIRNLWKKVPVLDPKAQVIRKKRLASMMAKFLTFMMILGLFIPARPFRLAKDWIGASQIQAPKQEEDSIEKNFQRILFLQEKIWKTLPVDEKLEVLQAAADLEMISLGLPRPLRIKVAELQNNALGLYSHPDRTIYFSVGHVQQGSADEVLDTLCHEAYHSYQYSLVKACKSLDPEEQELRICRQAEEYQKELSVKLDAGSRKGYEEYLERSIEKDARKYAQKQVENYHAEIARYLCSRKTKSET